MGKRLTILGFALLLAGCAHDYDQGAVPNATRTMRDALNDCEGEQMARAKRSYSQFTACELTAEREFATTIHLRRMDVFEIYASRMMALGADRDDGQLSPQDVQARANAIRKAYLADCECQRRAPRAGSGGVVADVGFGYPQPADPGPAIIGGAIWNGR
jgi:hypothetical protein